MGIIEPDFESGVVVQSKTLKWSGEKHSCCRLANANSVYALVLGRADLISYTASPTGQGLRWF